MGFARQYDLEGKFVVGYIGTHGLAHALHRMLETAELLRDRMEIVFLLVGGGARRDALVTQAAETGLVNVRFIPRQAKFECCAGAFSGEAGPEYARSAGKSGSGVIEKRRSCGNGNYLLISLNINVSANVEMIIKNEI